MKEPQIHIHPGKKEKAAMSTFITQAGLTLLIEAGLACILAVILGYLLWKSHNAAFTLGATTLVCNIFLLILALIFDSAQFPFDSLDLRLTKFADNVTIYLATTYLILEIAMWTTALASALGYFFDKGMGAGILAYAFTIAAMVCLVVNGVPYYFYGNPNTTWGLIIAVALVGTGGIWMLSSAILRGKGVAFLTLLWFVFVLTCWIGYQVAGRAGLLLITLPAQFVFWGLLYYFAILSLPIEGYANIPTLHNLLPFGDTVEPPVWRKLFASGEKDPRVLTLRSVLTLAMGTNYPFYVIDDWKTRETMDKDIPDPHVPGNPYNQFFAGPGIVLSNCDHLAVISDGLEFRVCPPGLSFTKKFEQLYTDVDLRPQLRATTVNAETKDGINVNIYTFIPNRVWANGRKPELGKSYPFDEKAVIKAVYNHAVMEHKFERDPESQLVTEEVKRRPWPELVLTMGPPILKDVVAHYTCNELHMMIPDPDKSRYGIPQKEQPFDAGEAELLYGVNLPLEAKLQQFMARHRDADDLKSLAFDLSADFSVLASETESELARALVEATAKKKGALNHLARQVQQRWPSTYIAQLFPRSSTYTPPAKVEVAVTAEEDSRVHFDALKATLAAQFDVPAAQIVIIGATKLELCFLVGIPADAVNEQTLAVIRPPAAEAPQKQCNIIALTAFDELPTEAQNAWRYASCSVPPTRDGEFIQPKIAWEDALMASRDRNPRIEIAKTFIDRLKKEMQPLGIEVVGGGISDIKVPKEVVEQRLRNWSAERDRDIEIAIAEAKARIALREQEVLGEVRLEMLTRLAQILQEAEDKVDKQILAIKLFEAMGFHPPSEAQKTSSDADVLPPYMLSILKTFGQ
ncbi:MAG: hypothetical protein JW934_00595 [Anaerolineae bacterium]|nr:hypothetical protein [Anaerolineae bacterium]